MPAAPFRATRFVFCIPRPTAPAVHALLCVALGAAMPLAQAQNLPATSAPTAHSFAIAAGPLAAALDRFARVAGVNLSYDAAQLAGANTPGLNGHYSAAAGLQQLLAGSGFEALGQPGGGFSLRRAASPTGAANAATASEAAVRLPEVRVSAAAELETASSPVVGYVAKRSTTASKTDTALTEAPQSISIIGAQELEDKGVTTLTEALQHTPGVTVNPYGFDSRALDWVLLRGFDGWYSSSYRDGLAQNVGITFLGVQTEVYGLERIEVLRGPSSVLFGKGDVGGVVNRVSKLPSADPVREVAVQLGSFNRKQLSLDVGGALDTEGKLLYRLVGVGLDTGTQEHYPNGVRMDQQRQYLAPSLRWQLAPATALTLQAEYLRDDASDDVQFVTGADGLPTQIKEGDPNYSRIKTGSEALGYQFEHRLDGGWLLQQKMRYAHRSSDKHHILSFFDTSPTLLERQARHDVESVNEAALDTTAQGTVQWGGIHHGLLFGLDYDRNRANWRRDRDMTTPLDLANPVYGIGIAEPTTTSNDTNLTSTQWGVYAQDQIRFDPHWLLTLGARHDRVTSTNDDRLNSTLTRQTDNANSGRIGLNYLVGNGWAPYASYAESFVPNVGMDSVGTAFQPSRGKQVELGVRYVPEKAPISFAAALFNLQKNNVVSYDPNTFEARQIGAVRSRGLELEAKAALSAQLRLTASLTVLDLKVRSSADSTEVGKTPILTPQTTAALWLDYAVPGEALRGLAVGGGLRYIGKRWNDAANTSSEPAYTLADVALRWDTGPWRFALNVSNLFNKQYYSGHSYGSYFRGSERTALLTARYRF